MPSTAKTNYLKLNQWVLEDKPQMEDFNKDNQLVDEHFSDIETLIDGVLTQLELLRDIVLNDVQDNNVTYQVRNGINELRILQGVYNRAAQRLEC